MFDSLSSSHVLIALAAGIIPAIIWLFFWIREDADHPEPAYRIFITFLFGMIAAFVTIGVQLFFRTYIFDGEDAHKIVSYSLILGSIGVLIYAFVEEFCKFVAAYFGGIHTRDLDEPIDVIVYLLASALGFAALENALYILSPLVLGDTSTAILTGNMRFIGATLLHVGSSLMLGFIIAFSIFKNKRIRHHHFVYGLITVVLLHALFNLLIILYEEYTVIIFAVVWLGLLASLFIFEKLKRIHLNRIQ